MAAANQNDWLYFKFLLYLWSINASVLAFLPFLTGDQPGRLGEYNVLCSRHTFILGLDVLWVVNRGEYMSGGLSWMQLNASST
jgi:hypothetical protein